MFELSPTELVGYAASALIVVSLAMRSVVRLRAISLVGSLTFTCYGLLIGSLPIVVTNVAIAVINVWFLRAELGLHRHFGAVHVALDEPFLADFVEYHQSDIERFQPDFVMPDRDAFALVLMRDGLPAGVLIGQRSGDELHVVLDYVVRPYRDSRIGNWLFGPGADVFRTHGFRRLTSIPGDETHRGYLARVGFAPDGERFTLEL